MSPRIDQWLWAVRLFKTRSLAGRVCRNGRVRIAGNPVKPSHPVRIGDIISIKNPPIWRQYRVNQLASKRVSAPLARELVEEVTPAVDLEKLDKARRHPLSVIFGTREKGSGRPTKKERRHLDKLLNRTPGDSKS